ncbi:hypothetical protein BX600DRAFT_508274 [Xylariales sp. PMI_506]|nr:hypothetical protein BX600DRAFT_508274 [Xylariales sp. PMI_506]
MGRKQAPQPLALANSRSHSHSQAQAQIGEDSSVSPRALTTSAPNSGIFGSQGHLAGVGGETTLQIVSSPTSSKSPNSPRSPFSKFNSRKASESALAQPKSDAHPVTPITQIPKSKFSSQKVAEKPASSDSPQFDYRAGPVPESYEQEFYHYPQGQPNPADAAQTTTQSHATPDITNEAAGTSIPVVPAAGTRAPPQFVAKPPKPAEPREEEKHTRSASRFFNFKSSKAGAQPREHSRGKSRDRHRGRDHSQDLNLKQANGSSEAMSRGTEYPASADRTPSKHSKLSDQADEPRLAQKPTMPTSSTSDTSLTSSNTEMEAIGSKKGKPKPFALLSRSRSVKEKEKEKEKDSPSPKDFPPHSKLQEPERVHTSAGQQPLRTAPVDKEAHDRQFRSMVDSAARNHSVDRSGGVPRDIPNRDIRAEKDRGGQNRSHPSSFKESGSSNFLSGLKTSGSRAADMLSRGFFGSKSNKTQAAADREHHVDDEHYQIKVLNLPLIEQTRKTRISKRLEEARDKTEFWMPSFPWRAIDYLNYKGCDVEGLYRVPGSGPQIKKWQRRFDEEYDVDLFAQDDLYDINIIGSMLKAWLRELPDELFPKEAQERIARECAGAEEVPQMLIDELSNLSPFNYYLLFAITCHLSLLLAHSDKNKMDFRNLCICFQPCMKIDAFCFRFLVCDWRSCWQGCKSEAKYIEQEYARLELPPPKGLGAGMPQQNSQQNGNQQGNAGPGTRDGDDLEHEEEQRNISSSEGAKTASTQGRENQNGKLRKKPGYPNGSMGSVSTGVSAASRSEAPRSSTELRPLSPIKPLSPLGF